MGNVGSRVTFRVGPQDASGFAQWLGREVYSDDLTRLPNFTALCGLSSDGIPLDPLIMRSLPAPGGGSDSRAAEVRERSRTQWGRATDQVEQDFFDRWADVAGSHAAKARRPGEPSPPSSGSFVDDWLAKRERSRPAGATTTTAAEDD